MLPTCEGEVAFEKIINLSFPLLGVYLKDQASLQALSDSFPNLKELAMLIPAGFDNQGVQFPNVEYLELGLYNPGGVRVSTTSFIAVMEMFPNLRKLLINSSVMALLSGLNLMPRSDREQEPAEDDPYVLDCAFSRMQGLEYIGVHHLLTPELLTRLVDLDPERLMYISNVTPPPIEVAGVFTDQMSPGVVSGGKLQRYYVPMHQTNPVIVPGVQVIDYDEEGAGYNPMGISQVWGPSFFA